MRIETLREFIAVALCQSLTKASRELFVAQSTLSAKRILASACSTTDPATP